MALKKLKYSSLEDVLDREPIAQEGLDTAKIIQRLKHVRMDGQLSRREFLDVCYWKSPRSVHHCKRNSTESIASISRKVFSTRSEKKRIELLTSLHGVSIPTASAILTLTNPARYGVIDIRVWQVLYRLGSVNQNARGQGFSFEQWYRYLRILSEQARRLRTPVRLIELTLFKFHQRHQRGTLYKTQGKTE
jgi:hypothetical protein